MPFEVLKENQPIITLPPDEVISKAILANFLGCESGDVEAAAKLGNVSFTPANPQTADSPPPDITPVRSFPRLVAGFQQLNATEVSRGNPPPFLWAEGVNTTGNFSLNVPTGYTIRYAVSPDQNPQT